MKKPGGLSGHRARNFLLVAVELDHAEHDRCDKGKGEIRRQYAQLVDESHGDAPLVYVTARTNAQSTNRFRQQKVSSAVYVRLRGSRAWLKTHEINALMSL
jgi:hypothetical protein